MSANSKLRKNINTLSRKPWVGAEEKWRKGDAVSQPGSKTVMPDSQGAPAGAKKESALSGLELTEQELQTVHTVFPEPPDSQKSRRSSLLTKMTGAAVVMAVFSVGTWVVLPENFSRSYASATPWPPGEESDTPYAASFPMGLSVSPLSEADNGTASVAPWAEHTMTFDAPISVDHRTNDGASFSVAPAAAEFGNMETTTAPGDVSVHGAIAANGADGAVETTVEMESTEPEMAVDAVSVSEVGETANDHDSQSGAVSALNTMLSAKAAPTPKTVAPRSAVPVLPPKDAVRSAMQLAAPQIKKCRISKSGKILVKLVVSGETGRVVSSQVVDDTFRGTSTGLCAARVVSTIKLPSFQKKRLIIKYPFAI